jgi:2-keto-4-pentenoate hydratase/2-oxohepta-3-ene-1,7-dioic acid hydratase in catechol pathway
MRLVAFTSTLADGAPGRRLGIERPDGVLDLTDALGADLSAVLAGADPVAMLTDAEAQAAYEGQAHVPLADVRLMAPLAQPGKIVCVGLNYRDHCREQNVEPPAYPTLFAKFASAISDPGMPIVRPRATEMLDLECELAVVIGWRASRVSAARALDHVFGFTILNDVTARDLQREDRQWLRAKGWDGFAPLGPAVVTRDEIDDLGSLAIRSRVNGETWQDSSTAEMIWDVASLLAFISRSITLEPGDIVATGTPAGVGHFHQPPRYLAAGDVVACEIGGIGVLENPIVDEQPRAGDHAAASGMAELAAELPAEPAGASTED